MKNYERKLTVKAPAKVNFSLKVVGKRTDGYHELKMLMAPISLFDTITLEKNNEAGGIEFISAKSAHMDSGDSNLCHRAASYYFRETGIPPAVRIALEKKIPIGAGLGGGSSDAAHTILGLEKLFGKELSPEARQRAAFEVGADVPFFFAGGWAWVEGIGEIVTPVTSEETLWMVVVHPGVFLSTGAVFSRQTNLLTSSSLVPTIMQFNFRGVCEGLYNDLQTPALELEPAIGEVIGALEKAGSEYTLMSGSGSAVFGMMPERDTAHSVADSLAANAPQNWRIEVAHTIGRVSPFSGIDG